MPTPVLLEDLSRLIFKKSYRFHEMKKGEMIKGWEFEVFDDYIEFQKTKNALKGKKLKTPRKLIYFRNMNNSKGKILVGKAGDKHINQLHRLVKDL